MRKHIIRLTMLGMSLASVPALAEGGAAAPTLNGGDRIAAQADATAAPDATGLLRQAGEAARRGRLLLANEYVERAETLVLTRSTLAGTEHIPVREGLVGRLDDARAALARRDIGTATALMAEAASMTSSMGM